MKNKSYKTLRLEAKKCYKNIGILSCPAFPNEKIYFQNAGFKHLIYKKKRFRPIPDQIRRFESLQYVRKIMINSKIYSEYRKDESRLTTAHFWSFEEKVNEISITVIIRRIDCGPLHFFSVTKD